jgi:hypothetical protein
MNASNKNPAAVNPTNVETRQIVLKEIGAKRDRLSDQDLSALKNKDDVVTQVVAKYGLDKVQSQRDVERSDERPSHLTPALAATPGPLHWRPRLLTQTEER